ncbi:hypothetical protein [Streptomyces sp. H39-S7]|uniref:hypothetical protein n=1 Tax=Streptomyces sp. H39-S7 TaxID=3004357 RepID=UPI0022AE8A72|nr:hypothetical protein [Streptomyces sp. H39-S7]MCZ4125759.1 hypothetical protein [Streptomyces sp. H39-S7]
MTTAIPDQRTVPESFPAGTPRGSCPADEYTAAQRAHLPRALKTPTDTPKKEIAR